MNWSCEYDVSGKGTCLLCPALFHCKRQCEHWAWPSAIRDHKYWSSACATSQSSSWQPKAMVCQGTCGPSLSFSTAWQKQLTPCSHHAPRTCSFTQLHWFAKNWFIHGLKLSPRDRSKSFKNRLPFLELFTWQFQNAEGLRFSRYISAKNKHTSNAFLWNSS